MNFWERLKMRLEKRAQKRFREQTNGNGFIFSGDIVHGRNYPIFHQCPTRTQRLIALIQQLMPLLIDEVKYFFQGQPEITLTDAIYAWNYYLEMKELSRVFGIDDIIYGRNYKSYPSISASFPITLR
jgi:hypothetical protein